MRYVLAIATAAVVLLSGVSAPVFAADKTAREEAKMTLDQVPAPVKASLEKEAKDGSIGEITQETKSGKMYYEAQIHRKNGKDRYVHVAPDGKILKHESAKKEAKERAKEPAASVK